jgi:hypothetical protein
MRISEYQLHDWRKKPDSSALMVEEVLPILLSSSLQPLGVCNNRPPFLLAFWLIP